MNEGISKTHVKFTKATLAKEVQKITKAANMFWLQGFSKDYMDFKQVVQNTTFKELEM